MLDENLNRKLRLKQAQLIKKTKTAVTFSEVVNDTLEKGLKN